MGIAEQFGIRDYTGGRPASPVPSRPLRDAVATPVTESNAGNAGNGRLTPAEKQRRYRERKKLGG